MGTLGDDLVLLAINPRNGVIRFSGRLRMALMGAELAELAAAGRIEVVSGRIVVGGAGSAGLSTDDQLLDTALGTLAATRRDPRPASWVGRPRSGIVNSYLTRLADAGVVERRRGFLVTRWPIIDGGRASAARARLDVVVLGSGGADTTEVALAGLVSVVGLSRLLCPGKDNRLARRRMRDIAGTHWAVVAVRRAIASAESSS